MCAPEIVPLPNAAAAHADPRFDAVVVVGEGADWGPAPIAAAAKRLAAVDDQVGRSIVFTHAEGVPGERLVLAPTGALDRDYDDVRRFADAARAGIRRVRDAGAKAPLLLVTGTRDGGAYARAHDVALLGALDGLWAPLEAREARGDIAVEPITHIGMVGSKETAHLITALELGRRLTRDLGGTEPERTRPEAFAALCVDAFEGTGVKVDVIDDLDALHAGYPLMMSVARASLVVPRHRPRVLRLEYVPEGEVDETLLFAGKGVTYDTGGADLKTDGHMAGMSRDKLGAAAVAGFVRAVASLAPRGVRVVAEIGLVRNSIGADAFVSDEIITSHAGARVRIGNTDAEGRLVLADLLSHCRETAVDAINPRLFTLATLTGHSVVAVGPYSIALDNGPARHAGVAAGIAAAGEQWGDPFEISRLRREDFDFVQPRSQADDVLSCNNAPSSRTPRGHQFPMAFLAIASGLDKHGGDGDRPLPYTHIDIGGSAAEGSDWQHGRPTGAPVIALATRWGL